MLLRLRGMIRLTCLFLAFTHQAIAGSAPVLTADQWRSDLRFVYEQMQKKHKNLFHLMPKTTFDAAVASLDRRIPDLTTEQIEVELAKLVALVGDGHTAFELTVPFGMHGVQGRLSFPVDLYLFSDGLFLRSADQRYAAVVGGKVIKIGPYEVDKAIELALPLVSRDNDMDAKGRVPRIFTRPELMKGLGLSASLEEVQFTIEKDGKASSITVRAVPYEGKQRWIDAAPAVRPLWQSHPEDFYWFQYLPDTRTLYVQYNAVANKADEPIPAFFDRVFAAADKSPVDRFVLDMRNNDGGNNYLNRPILLGIIRHTALDKKGTFFTIVGRQTFSAAMNLANQLERYTNVTFVGEPTGGRPNSYGDNTPIEAPNSKLKIFVSTLWWQDQDPRDTRPWIAPQVAVGMSSDDYFRGIDRAMTEIQNYAPSEPIGERLRRAISNNDWKKAREELHAFLADRRNRYMSVERYLNSFGYELAAKGEVETAIQVFQLNVDAYPESANVYDSLAEAYLKHGDRQRALENYQKALKLNPSNAGASEAINRLQKETVH